MSVTIMQQCITCGACEWECPNQAISPGMPRPVVNEDLCTECYGSFGESQCIVVCPVAAIKVNAELVEELSRRFETIHSGQPMQDTWIWRRIGSDVALDSTCRANGNHPASGPKQA